MANLTSAELLAEVSDETVAQFRTRFLEENKKEIEEGLFDQRDVDGLLDDLRIRSFVRFYLNNLEWALKYTKRVFLWRKENAIRDVQFTDFPTEIMRGTAFYRNKDTAGNNILWILISRNTKGVLEEERKRCFAALVEQHFIRYPGERCTIVFDLTNCGLGQADLELLKHMIACFQHHFPFFINKLLVYNMPWLLSGIWTLVKGWLPVKAQEKVVFVTDDSIDEYITRANRLTHVAEGSDDFVEVHGVDDPIFKTPSELFAGTPRRN